MTRLEMQCYPCNNKQKAENKMKDEMHNFLKSTNASIAVKVHYANNANKLLRDNAKALKENQRKTLKKTKNQDNKII